ncbi:MAG TPA: type II toxin-antitoxin system RelE/ParE family toxin [Xanthobacteraceae bacterium]|nr:type II toxin-antitoxin system RelE/ParE family toxin [Xanthobacteraceae bacterium]
MIVVITEAAEADLEAIGDWIAEDNPARALTFVRELRRRCETLADAPRGYVLVPRYEHLGVRRRPYRDYLIFYRIVDDTIEVLHVIHGARDYESILSVKLRY